MGKRGWTVRWWFSWDRIEDEAVWLAIDGESWTGRLTRTQTWQVNEELGWRE